MRSFKYLLAGWMLLGILTACEELPPEEEELEQRVFLSVFLEPGNSGIQELYLSHMVSNSVPLNQATTFVPDADILLINTTSGDSVMADMNLAKFCDQFVRDSLVLNPYDEVTLQLSGTWDFLDFSGEASTTVVSSESFDWTLPVPADTVMLHDESLEEGLVDPTAFYINWEHLDDEMSYRYQLHFNSVVYDTLTGDWIDTPAERRYWLRSDEEMAWQWAPYPTLMSVPSIWTGADMRVSWGAFVFLDAANDTLIDGHERRQGYYEVQVQRLNADAYSYYFSVHQWIRMFEWDPIEFNLTGNGCDGIVASLCRQGFRVQIVDGWGD